MTANPPDRDRLNTRSAVEYRPVPIVVLAVLLCMACASSQQRVNRLPWAAPGTAILLGALVDGRNLDMELAFLPSDRVAVAGNAGCPVTETTGENVLGRSGTYRQYYLSTSAMKRDGETLRLDCRFARVQLTRGDDGMMKGTASLLEDEAQLKRGGECEVWYRDPQTGRNISCARLDRHQMSSSWGQAVPLEITIRQVRGAAGSQAGAGPRPVS